MIVCDRCGKKIDRVMNETRQSLNIYSTEGCYIGHSVDLCKECYQEYEIIKRKAESYFMVNKDKPSGIFDNVKYWATV